jgi:hypothetical protein
VHQEGHGQPGNLGGDNDGAEMADVWREPAEMAEELAEARARRGQLRREIESLDVEVVAILPELSGSLDKSTATLNTGQQASSRGHRLIPDSTSLTVGFWKTNSRPWTSLMGRQAVFDSPVRAPQSGQ